jgi:hypothetical protein
MDAITEIIKYAKVCEEAMLERDAKIAKLEKGRDELRDQSHKVLEEQSVAYEKQSAEYEKKISKLDRIIGIKQHQLTILRKDLRVMKSKKEIRRVEDFDHIRIVYEVEDKEDREYSIKELIEEHETMLETINEMKERDNRIKELQKAVAFLGM